MRYALIEDTKIINVVVADEGWTHPTLTTVADPDGLAEPGGFWDGTQFLPPPPPPAPEPKPVTEVTMRQARLALLAADKLDDVEYIISNADRAVQIEWEYATVVQRASPLVEAIGTSLGMTDADIDALFADAATR
jgi:hypothetical protein